MSEEADTPSLNEGRSNPTRQFITVNSLKELSSLYSQRCKATSEEVVPFLAVIARIKQHYKAANRETVFKALISLLHDYSAEDDPTKRRMKYINFQTIIPALLSTMNQEIVTLLLSAIPTAQEPVIGQGRIIASFGDKRTVAQQNITSSLSGFKLALEQAKCSPQQAPRPQDETNKRTQEAYNSFCLKYKKLKQLEKPK